MQVLHAPLTAIGFTSLILATCYSLISLTAVLIWRLPKPDRQLAEMPPATILKPLCGAEPQLYDDLRSFCVQDYPTFQLVFGIRDLADPARAVAERLQGEFPHLGIEVVVNPQLHGQNCKVSNLINMLPFARYDFLAIADSDCLVEPHYLAAVIAPLSDCRIGLTTCLCHDVPTPGLWSRLGAMYINEWYVPSVLLAWLFGHQGYVSGQTVCLTRQTLEAIGGFEAFADHLADDYRLGELVRRSGRRIELSPYVVTGVRHEPSLDAVVRHEHRWMRTLAVLRPVSFRGLFLSFSLPLAALGAALVQGGSPSWPPSILLILTGLARLIVHFAHRLGGSRPLLADLWLVPVRDVLICWVWFRSFFTSQVLWRGLEFGVSPDGIMRRL